MAVSPKSFPPRRRRPSAASFLSPNLSTLDLLRSLHSLSLSISSFHPPPHLLFRRNSSSIIRKSNLLSLLFEEILFRSSSASDHPLHPSAYLCFEEMYIVLLRIQTLIEDCSNGSKMWLLMQNHSISNTFRELTLDLWTILEILPDKDLGLSDDVKELKDFLIQQCRREGEAAFVDPTDEDTRVEVLNMLDSIKRGIAPDHSRLSHIFLELGLSDSAGCGEEIECLQDELHSQTDDNSKSDLTALIGLVRYAKCVLFGASSPESSAEFRRENSSVMNSTPSDFRCPITLDLMTDPVVVATGQTYDRSSITLWFESGHNTCPKTGQTLAHTNLISNLALKNLIGLWCREQKIPYAVTDLVNDGIGNGVKLNKTALEATKMTISFLVNKLVSGGSNSTDGLSRLVYELRVLAKTDSDSRSCMGEAGVVPLLVRFLTSDDPDLQVNAVTTVLNLSILEENKKRIMETDGALKGVIEVLRSGAIWEAKGNAAATIFSLSGVHSYRKKLGRKSRVVKGLLDLARDGPTNSKRDALVAILSLAGDRESVGRFVEQGVMDVIKGLLDELPDEAVTVLELIVKRGGLVAVAAAVHMIGKLSSIMRTGTSAARESTVATLVMVCRKGGAEMVAELAKTTTIEVAIWELMGNGTPRAKRKAASLMRMIQRWAAGLEGDALEAYSVAIAMP